MYDLLEAHITKSGGQPDKIELRLHAADFALKIGKARTKLFCLRRVHKTRKPAHQVHDVTGPENDADKAPSEKTPAEKAPSEKIPAEKAPSDKAPAEKAPTDQKDMSTTLSPEGSAAVVDRAQMAKDSFGMSSTSCDQAPHGKPIQSTLSLFSLSPP